MLNSNDSPNVGGFDNDDDYPRTVGELEQWILENWSSLSPEHRAELFLAICEALGISVTEGLRRCGWLPPDDSERKFINMLRETQNDPKFALGARWVKNHVLAWCDIDVYPDEHVNEDWRQAMVSWSASQ